jgi:hypothetical protein
MHDKFLIVMRRMLPSIVKKAQQALAKADTISEIAQALELAGVACDMAKRTVSFCSKKRQENVRWLHVPDRLDVSLVRLAEELAEIKAMA